MKFVIQRVAHACVKVEEKIIGQIGKGFLVLIGIGREDTENDADLFVRKMCSMRIFEDENGKTNLALKDVGGEILLISQFTLYANCKKGNRPSFIEAKEPIEAKRLYDYIVEECRKLLPVVQTGSFGAEMNVELVNDGPFTIVLDSRDL